MPVDKKKLRRDPKLSTAAAGKIGQGLFILGYRDYIAARFLLTHDFLFQGAMLASTAVEKYLKAVLVSQGLKARGHLDNLEIARAIEKTGVDLLQSVNKKLEAFHD